MNALTTQSTTDMLNKLGNVQADVGMNEIVSVFVSRYETGLFAKKDELSAKIKAAKKAVEDHESLVIGSVDRSKYSAKVESLGLTFKCTDVSVNWKSTDGYHSEKAGIKVFIGMNDGRERDAYSKTITLPLSAEAIKERAELTKAVASLESELLETMTQIKAVSRKERELRGRISEMKLQQAGFAELINNPDLQKLIAIK